VEGGGILTLWYNKTFNCVRVVEGKGFIIIEGEYKTGEGDRVTQAGIINVYSSCLMRKLNSRKKLNV